VGVHISVGIYVLWQQCGVYSPTVNGVSVASPRQLHIANMVNQNKYSVILPTYNEREVDNEEN
jgi:hypothetical protein